MRLTTSCSVSTEYTELRRSNVSTLTVLTHFQLGEKSVVLFSPHCVNNNSRLLLATGMGCNRSDASTRRLPSRLTPPLQNLGHRDGHGRRDKLPLHRGPHDVEI